MGTLHVVINILSEIRRKGQPLAEVVSGLVRTWFQETLEVSQQALNLHAMGAHHAAQRICIPVLRFVRGYEKCFFQQLHVQAAKSGNTEQMVVLSSMLDAGYGCTADPLQAKVWAHKAAAQQRNA